MRIFKNPFTLKSPILLERKGNHDICRETSQMFSKGGAEWIKVVGDSSVTQNFKKTITPGFR